jgi:hypothetical protein
MKLLDYFQNRHIYDIEGTQQERVLHLLQTKRIVPLPMILDLSPRIADHHTVIRQLKRKGHLIENKRDPKNGVTHSVWYYHGQLIDNQLPPCEQ